MFVYEMSYFPSKITTITTAKQFLCRLKCTVWLQIAVFKTVLTRTVDYFEVRNWVLILKILKGQCHEVFETVFFKKTLPVPVWKGNKVYAKFFLFTKIFAINVCQRSRWLLRHRQQTLKVFSQSFKGTIRRKSTLNIWKRGHVIFELCDRIS